MIVLIGNLGRDPMESMYSVQRYVIGYRQPTGRDHCPALSISDDMPESGGGAGVADGVEVAASDDDDDGGDADSDPDRRKAPRTRKQISGAGKRASITNKRRDGAVNNMTDNPSAEQRNATATAGAPQILQNPDIALWKLPTVLAHVPVSRSGWWAGVKTGRYPAPVRLSTRCVAWKSTDIIAFVNSL